MVSRLTDSRLYSHLWGTDEARVIFEEHARLQSWLDILSALAGAQASLGIIPAEAADLIDKYASIDRLDIEFVADETRATGHSTLGLIHGLQRILPPEAREWVYYGATVQDVTDTWTAMAMKAISAVVRRDLDEIEDLLLDLAVLHRDTVMAGRTHGQPGAPITFGFKVAVWADEIRRHLERLDEGMTRWAVGQLGGAVGTLGFFGDRGLELRAAFCRRLELAEPGISWLTSRDRVNEFLLQLAMIASTLARIGSEIYELQRPEIGELREPAGPDSVGSITMPHKRNPELSEHLVTLSRLIRAQAGAVLESMVHEHERDGRSWKVEWAAFPDACLLTAASLGFAKRLLAGLEVDTAAMRHNLETSGAFFASERALAVLAPHLGKHRAQALLQDALAMAREQRIGLAEALSSLDEIRPYLTIVLEHINSPEPGQAGAMVDEVLRRAREARMIKHDVGV